MHLNEEVGVFCGIECIMFKQCKDTECMLFVGWRQILEDARVFYSR